MSKGNPHGLTVGQEILVERTGYRNSDPPVYRWSKIGKIGRKWGQFPSRHKWATPDKFDLESLRVDIGGFSDGRIWLNGADLLLHLAKSDLLREIRKHHNPLGSASHITLEHLARDLEISVPEQRTLRGLGIK